MHHSLGFFIWVVTPATSECCFSSFKRQLFFDVSLNRCYSTLTTIYLLWTKYNEIYWNQIILSMQIYLTVITQMQTFTFISFRFHLSNFHSETVIKWISYSSWICSTINLFRNAFHVFKALMEIPNSTGAKSETKRILKLERNLASVNLWPKHTTAQSFQSPTGIGKLLKNLWGCLFW